MAVVPSVDNANGMPGTGQGQLVLGGTVGVVEGRLRRASLGDPSQVLDGERILETPGRGVEARLAELEQRRQFTGPGRPSLHHAPNRPLPPMPA
jgi:hypothetical protein